MKLRIVVDNQPYEVEVDFDEDESSHVLAGYVPPYAPAARVTIPPPLTAAPAPAAGAAEERLCRCPMAGIVIKVNVQEGQEIQINDLLMVLEA